MVMKKMGIIGGLIIINAMQNDLVFAQVEATRAEPMLEEIIVTAQRRAQSLQEVPISVEAFSGAEIDRQGFRNMSALADFSATVLVNAEGVNNQNTSIRGFGTTGNALTLEQATPTFVDGIHFGRASQIKTAFMDVGSVEVLKGPQPVYFGQNATAGAFNIRSRMPTPEWEGKVDFEFANNGTQGAVFGTGGPLTDTLGIRLAGQYKKSDGYMKSVISNGKIGKYENMGGRIILKWTPTSSFDATAKIEGSTIRADVQALYMCLTSGVLGNPRGPLNQPNDQAVWADPPMGIGWVVPHTPLDTADDCFSSNKGLGAANGPYFAPPDGIRANFGNVGAIDMRKAAEAFTSIDNKGIQGYEDIDSYTSYLDLVYRFENEIEVNWLTAFSRYVRNYVRNQAWAPIYLNQEGREEDFNQWSSELRLTSPVGGMFEWMAGAYWQNIDYDAFSSSLRADLDRSQRFNDLWEDQEWMSGFATVTFNFLSDKASIDLGGRYSHLSKTTFIRGYGAQWIFDVPTANPLAVMVDPATARILVPGADLTNLWTMPWRTRNVPEEWWGSRTEAVGLTAPDYSLRDGPHLGDFSTTEIDPQVTLRFRPNDEHTIYARWAQSYKAGGFDTGQTSISPTFTEYAFDHEYSETYEIGAKGNYWNRRARYDVALFELSFKDLQLSSATPNPNDPFININAGGQRVRGVEFNTQVALTEQLRMSLAGAIMDGEMTNYVGAGCTEAEAATAPESGCDLATGRIDRTGFEAPRTPDWKFVVGINYWMPIWDTHQLTFDLRGYMSDGYITNVNTFDKKIKYNRHEDLNITIGFGDIHDRWMVSFFGRNLLEARPSYNPEYDVRPTGSAGQAMRPTDFMSYGVKFEYNFFN